MNDFKILTKEDLHYITQNITPEEAQYVAGVSTLLNDVGNEYISRYSEESNISDDIENKEAAEVIQVLAKEKQDKQQNTQEEVAANILILNKLLGFHAKFANAVYACKTTAYKSLISDFEWQFKESIDECVKILKSNPYYNNINFAYNLQIPVDSEPLTLICGLKEIIFDYLQTDEISTDIKTAEDRVFTKVLDNLLRTVCKYIYEFRVARSAEYERDF